MERGRGLRVGFLCLVEMGGGRLGEMKGVTYVGRKGNPKLEADGKGIQTGWNEGVERELNRYTLT